MTAGSVAPLKRLQLLTLLLILGATSFLAYDRWRRWKSGDFATREDLRALERGLEEEDALVKEQARKLDQAGAFENGVVERVRELERVGGGLADRLRAAEKRAGAIRILRPPHAFVVQLRRSSKGGLLGRVSDVTSHKKDPFADAAGREDAWMPDQGVALGGPDAALPIDLNLAVFDGGPYADAILFVTAIVRANNDAGEQASRPNRLWLACDDPARGRQTCELAGPFFLAAKRSEEDSVAKSTGNTAIFEVTPRSRLSVGIDAEAQRLTADGRLDVYVKVGPLLVVRDE